MKKDRIAKWKITATALSLIGAGTLMFSLCTEAAAAAELKQPQTIPTTYSVTPEVAETAPEGYRQASYELVQDPLVDTKPTSKDLTMEEAAELGAQMLWEIYGEELDSVTFYMGYTPGTETFPRAFWSGDVILSGKRNPDATRYSFMIDAVTGERFNCGYGRTLDVSVSLDYDSKLAKDCTAYTDKAIRLAEEANIVHGPVAGAEYSSQGYQSNDPNITILVTGTNGEEAYMTFSRYDQTLLGILYDASIKISSAAMDNLTGEFENAQAL